MFAPTRSTQARTGVLDARSGVGTLAGGVCGVFGSPTTIVGAPPQSGLADGCYRYMLTGTDNLGHSASISTTVRVDSVAPTSSLDAAPTFSGTPISLTYAASDGGSGPSDVELWAKGPSDSAYGLVATDATPASPSFNYTARRATAPTSSTRALVTRPD